MTSGRRCGIACLAAAFGVSCSATIDGPDDPCASNIGEIAVVVTGRGPLDGELMKVGDTLTLRASVRPITNSVLNVSFGGCTNAYGDPLPATVAWSSQDTTIIRVSTIGHVQARAQGFTEVLARDIARALQTYWSISVIP